MYPKKNKVTKNEQTLVLKIKLHDASSNTYLDIMTKYAQLCTEQHQKHGEIFPCVARICMYELYAILLCIRMQFTGLSWQYTIGITNRTLTVLGLHQQLHALVYYEGLGIIHFLTLFPEIGVSFEIKAKMTI